MGLLAKSLGIKAFSIEDPSSPLLPASVLTESLGLGRSDAGVLVNSKQALRLSPVFACFKIISEDLSKIPLSVFKRFPDGSVSLAPHHPVHRLIHDEPNEIMTAMTFRGALITSALAHGNGYALIVRDKGAKPISLHLMPSEKTSPVFVDGEFGFATTATPTGAPKWIDKENVLHIVGLSFDGVIGHSPVTTCKNAVGIGLAAEKYQALFFGNGARATGVLTHPSHLEAEAYENLRKSVREWATGENAHRPIILEEGLKWDQITVNPDDGQVIECIVPGTLISMANGSLCPVEDITVGAQVMSWDGERLCAAKVKAVGKPPLKQLVRLTTARGRMLEVSWDHPCLGLRSLVTLGQRPTKKAPEWIKAGEFEVGNYIRTDVARATDAKYRVAKSEAAEYAWLLGALVGNGYLRVLGCSFTTSDPGVIDGMVAALSKLDGGSLKAKGDRGCDFEIVTNGKGRRGSAFRRLIRTAGIEGYHSWDKRVPQQILKGGPDAWAEFLSGLLDTDGTIGNHGKYQAKQSPRVVWSSCNRELLRDCQHLLAMLGVQSGIYLLKEGGKKKVICGNECKTRDSISLTVCGSANLRKLTAILKLRHSVKKTLLASYADLAESRYRETNNLYDRITKVESLGNGKTIGVEIEGTHTHVTNGLITHNTRKFQVEEIARLYRVPLHKLGELTRSTMNNIEHQGIEHIQDALQPWAVRIEQEVNRKLLSGNYFCEHDFAELARGDSASTATGIQTLRNIGVISTNDARRQLRMNPITKAEGGDIRIIQGANVPLTAMVNYVGPVGAGPGGGAESPDKEEADTELGELPPDKNAAALAQIMASHRRFIRDVVGRSINRQNDPKFVRAALLPIFTSMREALMVVRFGNGVLNADDEAKVAKLADEITASASSWTKENASETATRLTEEACAALAKD